MFDGIELPRVVLRFDVNPHPFAVVVLLELDEGFGSGVGEVGVYVYPLLVPPSDRVPPAR